MRILTGEYRWPSPAGPAGFAVCLVFAAAFFWYALAASPFLRGYDAYYYAVQADFWFRTGYLRIPDSSVVLYGIGGLQYFGLAAGQAVRAWVALSLLLFDVTFLLLLIRCRSPLIAALLFGWVLLSPTIAFVAVELPKTFSILVLTNIALFLATGQRIRWLPLLTVLALAVASHKMALVYVAVFALALGWGDSREKLDARQGGRLAIGVLAVACAGIIAFFVLGTLGRADFQRLQGGNFMPGLLSLLMRPGLPKALFWEIGFSACFAVAVLVRGREKGRGLAILLLLTTFTPAFGNEPLNFGERFGLMFPYLSLASGALLLRNKPLAGGMPPVVLVLTAALAGSFFRLDYSHPQNIDPPYDRYAVLTEELAGYDIPMLILHRGMHFYYKYTTRRDAFSYEPEAHWNKMRVWRLVYGATPEEIFAYLPAICIWGREAVPLADRDYTLIREDCYSALRAAVSREANPELYALLWRSDMNPSKPRPAFLYGKHTSDEPDEFPTLPDGK